MLIHFPSLKHLFLTLFLLLIFQISNAQFADASFVYGDLLPDAPELAQRGQFGVGVRTLELVHQNQLKLVGYPNGGDTLYDRPIKVEIWYPARIPADKKEGVIYDEVMGNANTEGRPLIPFSFKGRALRDAALLTESTPFPLVIVSHGYTGSRLLFTYLTENLASKGYVVVALDHTESTFRDANAFSSTLLNRSLDIRFVLDEMDRLSQLDSHFLNGYLDAENTALIGYSMGGYGVLNVAGAGYDPAVAIPFFKATSGGSSAIEILTAGNRTYEASMDPRIKAVVAFAPWGMERGIWNAAGLAGLKVPTMFVAGSEDDISGYEKGIKAIYEKAVSADRYLLTYLNARHNVAPNPAPPEALQPGLHIDEYLRYADSVWDQKRINNINQHFLTAFLGLHLKNEAGHEKYLRLEKNANDGPWEGFKPRTAVGLELLYESKK